MIVIPITSEIHSDTFAKALGCEVSKEAKETDWAFFVGGAPNEIAKACKSKTACYWIGSDSMRALQEVGYRKNIDTYDVHFCVHERIQEELRAWGIESHVVWPCARNESKGLEAPQEKLVGVYIPEPGLYMFEECKQIAKENPEIPFVFYGAMFEMTGLPENVKDAGRMSPEETTGILDRISMLLRLVRHDGMPIGAIEAKQRNRHVIENYPYPGFLYADTMERANEYLRNEENHKGDFGPWASYFRDRCSAENFKKEIMKVLG